MAEVPPSPSFDWLIQHVGEATPDGAVSPKGATGVMQVMPGTAANPGYGVRPAADSSPAEVERVGRDVANALLAHYGGNKALASAAYNAGPGRVNDWLKTIGDPRTGAMTDAEWASRLPFDETRNYVGRIGQASPQGLTGDWGSFEFRGTGRNTGQGSGQSVGPAPPNPLIPTSAPAGSGAVYPDWLAAARGGELASHAWANRPSMEELVPGFRRDSGLGQQLTDYGSLPARLLTHALIAPFVQGGDAMSRWMRGDQGEETKQLLTGAVVGMGMNALGVPKPTGSLGVFGGRAAATADLSDLAKARGVRLTGMTPSEWAEHGQLTNKTMMNPAEQARYAQLQAQRESAATENSMLARGSATDQDLLSGTANRAAWGTSGWFRDVDGNWKFEIPDSGSSLRPEVPTRPDHFNPANPAKVSLESFRSQNGRYPKLSEVLDHPELFSAYPALADIPVGPMPMLDIMAGVKGAFLPGKDHPVGSIRMSGANLEDFRSTLLHEIQHGVQDIEGFATGGNVGQFLPEGFAETQKTAAELYQVHANEIRALKENPAVVADALKKQQAGKPLANYEQKALAKVRVLGEEFLDDFHYAADLYARTNKVSLDAFRSYQSLAGEVESRNVQERLKSGLGRETAPWATPGYPIEPQTVRFKDGTEVRLTPVPHDPFTSGVRLRPVAHNPFEGPAP